MEERGSVRWASELSLCSGNGQDVWWGSQEPSGSLWGRTMSSSGRFMADIMMMVMMIAFIALINSRLLV